MSDCKPRRPSADKLHFLKSPLSRPGDGHANAGKLRLFQSQSEDDDGSPETPPEKGPGAHFPDFVRHAEPTLLEVFFDLFFAANYNVFSDNQEVTSRTRLNAYLGYFFLLWVTWLLTTLFDVRYVTDCVFARLTRAVQLGVLVGFTIVAPKFDPGNQHADTMQTMSLILMISRACLVAEYGATLWHVRHCREARLPLYLQMGVHLVAAIVYFAISFVFKQGTRSDIFIAWYLVSGVEMIVTILLSNFYAVLSLTTTHMIKRLTLLTVIIIGDGIIQVAREVVTIVKNPDSWDRVTIGLVTSATATIYFIFLVYFDWLRSSFYLPPLRQQLWMLTHLPFHLSLILFTQGFTQFLIWSKIIDVISTVSVGLGHGDVDWLYNATSQQVQERMNMTAQLFFRDFPPKIQSTWITVDDALANITDIPNAFWPDLANYYKTKDVHALQHTDLPATELFSRILEATMSSMANALFATFGMDFETEVTNKNPRVDEEIESGGFQGAVQFTTWDRYKLVFAYTYAAAGCTLLFMIILAVVARTTRFKTWPIVRLGIIFVLALCTSLTAILFFHPSQAFDYLLTLWVLPAITFVWAIVLVITHINGDNFGRHVRLLLGRQPLSPMDKGNQDDGGRRNGKDDDA